MQKILKDSLDPFLINISLLINFQLLTYIPDYSNLKIFPCQLLLEFNILILI